jgi:hypothetical protein
MSITMAYGNPFKPVLTEVPAHYAGSLAADEGVRRAAREIAGSMIRAARDSGDEPVTFVTGNSYMPALRSYRAAEEIWQAAYPSGSYGYAERVFYWEFLCGEVERLASEADVHIGYPEDDNSIYVVDISRFEYDEEAAETSDTYSGDWKPVSQPVQWYTVSVSPDNGEVPYRYRTQASSWEHALAGISALFPPEES